ncbi:phosphate ABC transporter, inner membrane subunit PstC [Rippkaea orientalis PCC 8801]|uniref:Phosphate transport system permease protein n=1 Tax=Rippkaea orientalis (strain PCC 8801 / RF-1) TaxID=41431 RepID=B7K0V7_RIPO1|nr:phosphate ABC transporter permease subunit PstC [Rippkaea orientalis]ACK65098.1 phosphate ABC transporter, inner membrane subunit PstC [Rippkaea orientalis PCC 8801]
MPQGQIRPIASSKFAPKVGRTIRETIIELILFLAAASSVATTIAILAILLEESILFFEKVSIFEFLTSTEWSPLFDNPKYGILPLVSGTLVTSFVALLVAIPCGTIVAIYLSEFAPAKFREVIKPFLEILAALPTVVYGYFALLFVTPFLQMVFPELPGFNMLSAGLVMGLMIIPFISSISEDAMRSVPIGLKEGSYAMGATRLQTSLKVVFPAAISGISASYILGASRAVGETMIVAIAAGLQPNLTWNPFDQAATITAYIVQVSLGDLPHQSLEYQTIFAAGLTLVLITLVLNIIGHFLAKAYRENY